MALDEVLKTKSQVETITTPVLSDDESSKNNDSPKNDDVSKNEDNSSKTEELPKTVDCPKNGDLSKNEEKEQTDSPKIDSKEDESKKAKEKF